MWNAISTAINGRVERMQLENSLQLQRHQLVRPEQIRLKTAEELEAVDARLAADPKLKKRFDSIKFTVA